MGKSYSSGIRVVAYASNAWDTALGVLRIVSPFQNAGIDLVRGNFGDLAYPEYVSQGDLVLIQRDYPRYHTVYRRIIDQAHALVKPVVFDLDDLLLELPPDHPDRLIYYYTPALLPILEALGEVDLVTVSTKALGESIQHLTSRICVLPNYLDNQIWKLHPPKPPSQTPKPVVIGYMGGPSHIPDLQYICPVLRNLLRRYTDQVQLHLYGVPPPPELADNPNVITIPSHSNIYVEFAADFQAQDYDIAIAPLVDNRFNRCKSGVKFLEYSALGLPGVYSRLEPYQAMVVQGENGFLATTLDEWEATLVRLIEDPDLSYQIALQAQATVAKDWFISQKAGQWRECYQELLQSREKERPAPIKESSLIVSILRQVSEWQEHLEAMEHSPDRERGQKIKESEVNQRYIEKQLDEIHKSKAWKVVLFMRRLRLWLIPLGSRREKIIKQILGIWHDKFR